MLLCARDAVAVVVIVMNAASQLRKERESNFYFILTFSFCLILL